ncbi:hypothetical protein PHLGIDRAFT_128071 [Phlebiopsis gigantea 11061_1 CR5-6]|uniref:Glucose-methanol-choline oxidoreductase N-terminal domain-containing protein n=1 Tax=Phlebiopsis gigantea (strain 11061_1 CR5-6) TaxID=745531 RepID=A0A0C3RXX2_PHLG1|nr:hypothetical protein PHLGIDRAFT_128071 [Phlebiopsis gigantea 11061_1 CR5-6]
MPAHIRKTVVASLCLALCADLAQAAVYTDAKHLPSASYDFVIVGAGTAGNVLASRLTEEGKYSVLVIEAGVTNEGVRNVEVPFLAPQNLPNSSVTWNYTTVPQTFLNDRYIGYTRGRLLGGSSSINFLGWTRGSNEEYDRWANLTGDEGWAWNNLAPYYFKTSHLAPSADHHDPEGQANLTNFGNGPLAVSLPGFPTELDPLVINTTHTNPEFPFALDVNAGDSIGIGYIQSTIGNGARCSSAIGYLSPALGRQNLDVLIHNTVTRLISTGPDQGKPTFKTVEFSTGPTATRHTVSAKREVILSAGSVGTPQILMLSGIGSKTSLSKVGIKSTVDLPDVGQNLHDHPILSNYWTVTSNETYDDIIRNATNFNRTLAQWQQTRTGLFTNSPLNTLGFLRIPGNDSIWKNFTDPSAGPESGHFEFLFGNGYNPAPVPATGNYLTIGTAIVSPHSVGQITLASNDPFAFPLIDPAFFSSPFDQLAMLYAIKAARRFAETAPWDGFVIERFGPVGTAETDEEIMAAARGAARSIYHPTSTARMSPLNATWGVTDPQLRVKHVSGLRIVDASTFPSIPAVHPQAAVYTLAERAADLIKAAWA